MLHGCHWSLLSAEGRASTPDAWSCHPLVPFPHAFFSSSNAAVIYFPGSQLGKTPTESSEIMTTQHVSGTSGYSPIPRLCRLLDPSTDSDEL